MTSSNETFEPIPISVPVIIDSERFNRVKVRRNSRSPRNKPPLHVTPKSTLTGLCRCGYCGCPMHISTGKSGAYKYLKCNNRNNIDNSICKSPTPRFDLLEPLVLQSVVENILTEARIKTILDDAKNNIQLFAATHSEEALAVQKKQQAVHRKLTNLLKVVEDGEIQVDGMLGDRIRSWQSELDTLNARASSLKVPVALPPNLLNDLNLSKFCNDIVAKLSDTSTDEAKAFLHLVVKEIRVYAEEITISGPNLGILEAVVAKKNEGTSKVPSFMYNWRSRRDSNPRWV